MNSCEKVLKGIGNTKQSPHAKHYCFTLNNYKNEDLVVVVEKLRNDKYVIGKEIGEEGTPHLQGYVCFEKPKRFTELKKLDVRIHWEKCRNIDASKTYCMKDNDYVTNIKMKAKLKLYRPLTSWADEIERLYSTEPDYRKIYWYWENVGNVGKSSMSKYMAATYPNVAVVQSCKSADILTVIEEDTKMLILDFPKSSHPGTYFPSNAVEQIKNGMITDAKLKKKARCLLFNAPHVVVFANEPPELKREMSEDRFVVKEINQESPEAC